MNHYEKDRLVELETIKALQEIIDKRVNSSFSSFWLQRANAITVVQTYAK